MNKEIFKDMGKGLKAMILKEAHSSGEPIAKVASKYTLPDMAIMKDDKFSYQGEMITIDEWKKINPAGEFGKIIIIKENLEHEKK